MATDAPLRDPVPRERELADVYDDLHVAYVRAPSPETAQLHLGRLGRRRRPARTRAAIVGGLASGLVVLTSVAASAGALPDPLQRAVAHAADAVGLTLPLPAGSDDAPAPSDPEGDDVGATPSVTAPGPTGEAPGLAGETPGQSGDSPSVTAPGQTGEAPGLAGETPGQSGGSPSVTAPGQSGGNPSVTAPGQSGEAPGQSGGSPSVTAPGQSTPPANTGKGNGRSG